jgi:hypothetical protein
MKFSNFILNETQRVFFLLFRSRELIQSLFKEFDPSSG